MFDLLFTSKFEEYYSEGQIKKLFVNFRGLFIPFNQAQR